MPAIVTVASFCFDIIACIVGVLYVGKNDRKLKNVTNQQTEVFMFRKYNYHILPNTSHTQLFLSFFFFFKICTFSFVTLVLVAVLI